MFCFVLIYLIVTLTIFKVCPVCQDSFVNVLLEEFLSVAFFPTSTTSLDLKYTQSILLRIYRRSQELLLYYYIADSKT